MNTIRLARGPSEVACGLTTYIQRVCHDPLPRLVSFSLGALLFQNQINQERTT